VVDGGGSPVDGLLKEFRDFKVDYIRSVPPSLTEQRNRGVERVGRDVTLVAFLDDDTVLKDDAISGMMEFWAGASPDTAGAAFNILTGPYRKPTLLEKIFLVNADRPNMILRSGFQTRVGVYSENTPVKWLVGCAMVWRKSIFREFRFDEKFTGYARYEEVDFSYRVGSKYKLYVASKAMAEHHLNPENVEFSFALGKMEIVNRLYLVRKNRGLSLGLCLWGCLGFFLNNAARGFVLHDRRYALKARGNIAGFLAQIAGKGVPLGNRSVALD
jgi:GT2 family glycosyltransferase